MTERWALANEEEEEQWYNSNVCHTVIRTHATIYRMSIVQYISDERMVDHILIVIANLLCSTQCLDVTTMQYKSVLHGCIVRTYSCAYGTFTAEAKNSPLCDRQNGIQQANPRFAGCIIRTSVVNPFKIRCTLQITKATVNETQWWHVINDVTNDVKLTLAIGVVLK